MKYKRQAQEAMQKLLAAFEAGQIAQPLSVRYLQRDNPPPMHTWSLHTLYLAAEVDTHRPQAAYQLASEQGPESDGRARWLFTNRRTRIGDVLDRNGWRVGQSVTTPGRDAPTLF